MARGFKSTPRGFSAELTRPERRLLRTLFNDVIELLDAGETVQPVAGPPAQQAGPPADRPGRPNRPGRSAAADAQFWSIVSGWDPQGPDAGGRLADEDAPASPTRPSPRDPAVARLLPDGIAGDERKAGEFRALTEDALRRAKTEELQRAAAALQSGTVVLDEPAAVAFSRALNDVRLVLSTRLDIQDEEDAERIHQIDDWAQAQDVESSMALLYNFTSWLLETLMVALTTQLPDGPD